MDHEAPRGSPRRDEDDKARVDRELIELLNELRVALPGVQVLFAFLLILPFQQGFRKLDPVELSAYVAGLLLAAASTALLMAPTSYHRLRFRAGDKERMLFTSNRLAIAGLALLAAAMAVAVFLIIGVLTTNAVALLVGLGTAAWFGVWWYALPLARKWSEHDGPR